jgi:hypothetical protein
LTGANLTAPETTRSGHFHTTRDGTRPAVPQVTLRSLTGLREKLIKIGSKVVSHGRYGIARYRMGTLILKTSGAGH